MVTLNKIPGIPVSPVAEMELKGLSSDEKPLIFMGKTVGENSLFLELDTGDLYYFTGGAWVKIGESGSGGGSGDAYETVAEFDVGTMEPGGAGAPEGHYVYASNEIVPLSDFSADDNYYFNKIIAKNDYADLGEMIVITFNCMTSNATRINPGVPAVMIIASAEGLTISSDSEEFSNTTVGIYKKITE